MKKPTVGILTFAAACVFLSAQEVAYTVGDWPAESGLGNHEAVEDVKSRQIDASRRSSIASCKRFSRHELQVGSLSRSWNLALRRRPSNRSEGPSPRGV